MRAAFVNWARERAAADARMVFLTGDLGFQALEPLRALLGERFINVGVAEQNMVSMAAALAREGLRPFCYSIAPFLAFRPAEQTRVDVGLHGLGVTLVGNGGGYGYGIMGATHHALEDLALLSALPNLTCFIPEFAEEVAPACDALMDRGGPAYLRLGAGARPDALATPSYASVRQWAQGDNLTVVACGPVLLEVLRALGGLATGAAPISADVFSVAQLPIPELTAGLRASVRKTRRVYFAEEHVSRGGVAEHLSLLLLREGLSARVAHAHARGYPGGLYGSQAYHWKQSGLDAEALAKGMFALREDA